MYQDETFSTLPTTEGTAVSTSENTNSTDDDVINVKFNDPQLMGDLFDFVIETALSQWSHDQFVDWAAEQLRVAHRQMAEADKMFEEAEALREKLEALRDHLSELLSQTSHPTTLK